MIFRVCNITCLFHLVDSSHHSHVIKVLSAVKWLRDEQNVDNFNLPNSETIQCGYFRNQYEFWDLLTYGVVIVLTILKSQLCFRLDLREGEDRAEFVSVEIKGRVSSQTGAQLTFNRLQGSDAGSYKCRVDFLDGPTLSSLVNLTVYGKLTIPTVLLACLTVIVHRFSY